MFSKRIKNLVESTTLAITEKAKKMVTAGEDVISLSAGEPDFDTPDYIKESAIKAIKDGKTKYTPVSGIPELKQAICEKLLYENNLKYSPDEVLVSCGAKHSMFNIIQTLVDDNDEVIVVSPYWVSYPAMIQSSGGNTVFLKTSQENNYQIEPSELKKSITNRTKLIMLNSPNNPTGAVYSAKTLETVAEITAEKNIFVISDEIYENLVYDDNKHISIATISDEVKKRTIVVNGVSKAYAMTGWRIGYSAGRKEIIERASALQSHSTSNPTSISQYAALTAIRSQKDFANNMKNTFCERRNTIVNELRKIPGFKFFQPAGAFFVFVDVSSFYNRKLNNTFIKNSNDFCDVVLTNAKVALVPGDAFGNDNFVRFSFAISSERLKEALYRISSLLS